nr:unnamed protein product [Callosobruchus analis]
MEEDELLRSGEEDNTSKPPESQKLVREPRVKRSLEARRFLPDSRKDGCGKLDSHRGNPTESGPSPKTKDDVMLGLKSQSGLDTDHWVVVGGNTTPEAQFLVIHIDEASLKKLRSLGMRPILRSRTSSLQTAGSRAATTTLCQKILADDIGVVLIQETWTVKGRVMGMSTAKGKLITDTQCDKPREEPTEEGQCA